MPYRARSRTSICAFISAGSFVFGVACAGPSTVNAPTAERGHPANVGALESDAGPPAVATEKGPGPNITRIPMPLCGCSLCNPVVSEDTCSVDADCAPATPCHAEACVAKGKAKALAPGASCTAILRCDTADANACGCREGHCALFARPK